MVTAVAAVFSQETFSFSGSDLADDTPFFATNGPIPCQFKVKDASYDLTSIKDKVYHFSPFANTYYMMSICSVINGQTPREEFCKAEEASVCHVTETDDQVNIFAVASANVHTPACTITFGNQLGVGDNGLLITCANGSSKECPANKHRTMVLEGICNPKVEGVTDFQMVASSVDKCAYVGSFTSSSACRIEGGGLSGFTIFLIILAVVVSLYILIGCIYNAQQGETTAYRRCPNVEFWIAIPTLFVTCYKRIYYKFKPHHSQNYETQYESADENSAPVDDSYQAGGYGTLA